MNGSSDPPFAGGMTERERFCALMFLPVHVFALPFFFGKIMLSGRISGADANLLSYAVSFAFILLTEAGFLRREFDPLCDSIKKCAVQIVLCYLIMMAMNLCVSGLLMLYEKAAGGAEIQANQNNAAILEMAGPDFGKMRAIGVFMAPIIEETLFRGGIFSSLREKNRTAAYAVSMAAFSLYHVWSYAVYDPSYWIYLIEYLPASFVLCRCYERTGTIWSPIFLHMLINEISLKTLTALEEFL